MPKTVLFDSFGGPEVLQLTEVEAREPGPGEVRVRVGAIGLNRVESHYRSGFYLPATFPSRIGMEAAGVVEEVGPGVRAFAPGDRVATLPGACMERYGTYGEAILYPADMLVHVGENQSLADAAACWMQYVTAFGLVSVAALAAGDTVAITAASSSVGLAAIETANERRAVPIAITRGRGKASALIDAGAAHVIVTEEEDIAARLRDITGGEGVNIAFDAVGGTMLPTLVKVMAPQGVLISYGLLDGPPEHLPIVDLIERNITLRGWSADVLTRDPDLRDEVVDYVSRRLAAGTFRPIIDRQFDLAEIVAAHRHLESNRQFGKIIVATSSVHE